MSCKPPACIGEMRHLVEVQEEVQTPTPTGGQTISWEKRGDWYCAIKMLTAAEQYAHQRLETRATHKFIGLYFPGVLGSDRISFDGRLFNIRRVENWKELSRYLVLHAEEGVIQ